MTLLPDPQRKAKWQAQLGRYQDRLQTSPPMIVEGRLTRMVGLTLEAEGCEAAIGDRCRVTSPTVDPIEAEVVGFAGDKLFLMPTGVPRGLAPNAFVKPMGQAGTIAVGGGMLGRVIDGAGRPLDGRGPIQTDTRVLLNGEPTNPLDRQPISQPLDVGVRAINALLTVGRGQRLGLFAGSGLGKSVLLGMMTRFTDADVTVVGLIGERGREVKDFVDGILGPSGLARAVVVATPSDNPPLMRLHGAALATSVAEYFRDQGRHVLLLMDSLTRFAQAQREIALAIGEPPATRGYPPSVFARMPQMVERAGNGGVKGGSITAIYTVLAEGDDHNDPIADASRAILDGHIVLSRSLAETGLYPAIDVEASISRAMPDIVDQEHLRRARDLKQIHAYYQQNRDLINVGAYTPGGDSLLDKSIAMHPQFLDFIHQDMRQPVTFSDSLDALERVMQGAAKVADPTPDSGGSADISSPH